MRKKWWFIPIAIVALPLLLFVGGEVVMRLWNWLLPPLFGWHMIGFWQALGLLALCRILFGHHGPRGFGPRRHWGGRCSRMTPEEREKFRHAMREGFEVGGASEKAIP